MFVRPEHRDVIEPYYKLLNLVLQLLTKDWTAEVRAVQKCVVMQGRYAGQSMDEVDNWEMSILRLRTDLIGELISEENDRGDNPPGPTGHHGR